MPTHNSAKILRLEKYGIFEGAPADLVVINSKTVQEAFRNQAERLYVISGGSIVATNRTTRTLTI